MQEIEIVDVTENEVTVTETTPTAESTVIKHSSLAGRCSDNQHSINAIVGLSDELAKITTPRTVESDKAGVADYYMWTDKNPTLENRVGYFVTCADNTIMMCTGAEGEDVFGVTVDNAGFVGGQDAAMPRDYRYGLVATGGFVNVRCASDVKAGDNVVPGTTSDYRGIAKKSGTDYGNKVISVSSDDNTGVRYARIFLGMSPKQASDIAGDIKSLKDRMDTTEESLDTLIKNTENTTGQISTNVNIIGGKIAGWDVTENSLEKTFEADFEQHKVVLDSNATDYVIGVSEEVDSQKTWKFGVGRTGDVDIVKANITEADITKANISEMQMTGGEIGGWRVGSDGFKAEVVQKDVCAISGTWTWNDAVVLIDMTQDVNFTSGEETFTRFESSVNDNCILFCNETGDVEVYTTNTGWITNTPAYTVVDFGSTAQYVSKAFYEYLIFNATQGEDSSTEYQEEVSYAVALNGNIADGNTKILEVKNNDESKFYVQADGTGYISNAENAEHSNKSTVSERSVYSEWSGCSERSLMTDTVYMLNTSNLYHILAMMFEATEGNAATGEVLNGMPGTTQEDIQSIYNFFNGLIQTIFDSQAAMLVIKNKSFTGDIPGKDLWVQDSTNDASVVKVTNANFSRFVTYNEPERDVSFYEYIPVTTRLISTTTDTSVPYLYQMGVTFTYHEFGFIRLTLTTDESGDYLYDIGWFSYESQDWMSAQGKITYGRG